MFFTGVPEYNTPGPLLDKRLTGATFGLPGATFEISGATFWGRDAFGFGISRPLLEFPGTLLESSGPL